MKTKNIWNKTKIKKSFQIPLEKRAKTQMNIAYPKHSFNILINLLYRESLHSPEQINLEAIHALTEELSDVLNIGEVGAIPTLRKPDNLDIKVVIGGIYILKNAYEICDCDIELLEKLKIRITALKLCVYLIRENNA